MFAGSSVNTALDAIMAAQGVELHVANKILRDHARRLGIPLHEAVEIAIESHGTLETDARSDWAS